MEWLMSDSNVVSCSCSMRARRWANWRAGEVCGIEVMVCGEVGVEETEGDDVDGGRLELKVGVEKVAGKCGGCMVLDRVDEAV